MHSFLIAFAYLAMVFSPCVVAHWGNLFLDSFGSLEPFEFGYTRLPQGISRLAFATHEAREELKYLAMPAFRPPVPLWASSKADSTADVRPIGRQKIPGHGEAAARVAARLAAMVEAHKLANPAVIAETSSMPFAAPAPAHAMYLLPQWAGDEGSLELEESSIVAVAA